MPHTSLSFARYSASGKAIWPAGPVRRIFSSLSAMGSALREVGVSGLDEASEAVLPRHGGAPTEPEQLRRVDGVRRDRRGGGLERDLHAGEAGELLGPLLDAHDLGA